MSGAKAIPAIPMTRHKAIMNELSKRTSPVPAGIFAIIWDLNALHKAAA